jgi:hypothetical protein
VQNRVASALWFSGEGCGPVGAWVKYHAPVFISDFWKALYEESIRRFRGVHMPHGGRCDPLCSARAGAFSVSWWGPLRCKVCLAGGRWRGVLRIRSPTFRVRESDESDFHGFERKRFFPVRFTPFSPRCACLMMRVSFRTSRSSSGWGIP